MTHILANWGKRLFALFLFNFLLLPAALRAQATGAKLEGIVVDAQGRGVADSAVTATNTASGAVKTTHSEADGLYSFDGLAAGTYTVEAAAGGFAKASKSGIVLAEGQSLRIAPLSLTINALNDNDYGQRGHRLDRFAIGSQRRLH